MGGTALIIIGGGLQMLGFVAIAVDLYVLQRDDFGTPLIVQRLRRLVTGPQEIVLNLSDAVAIANASMGRIRGTVRAGKGGTLEERVEALEKNIDHVTEEVDQAYRAIDREVENARQELKQNIENLDQAIKDREAERKNRNMRSRQIQGVAVLLFVVGTGLGVYGSV